MRQTRSRISSVLKLSTKLSAVATECRTHRRPSRSRRAGRGRRGSGCNRSRCTGCRRRCDGRARRRLPRRVGRAPSAVLTRWRSCADCSGAYSQRSFRRSGRDAQDPRAALSAPTCSTLGEIAERTRGVQEAGGNVTRKVSSQAGTTGAGGRECYRPVQRCRSHWYCGVLAGFQVMWPGDMSSHRCCGLEWTVADRT
jgi:hypothetical protein